MQSSPIRAAQGRESASLAPFLVCVLGFLYAACTLRSCRVTSAEEWWSRRTLQLGIVLGLGTAVLLGAALGFMPSDSWHRLFRKTNVPQIRSIAVLPLENLAADPAQEYFCDGMTDALITDLAQIGSVKVISRTSSMQYKQTKKSLPEIARELNVDGMIESLPTEKEFEVLLNPLGLEVIAYRDEPKLYLMVALKI